MFLNQPCREKAKQIHGIAKEKTTAIRFCVVSTGKQSDADKYDTKNEGCRNGFQQT